MDILNGQKNLRPMLKEFNSSKGMRNASDWKQTAMGQQVSTAYLKSLHTLQRQVATSLNKVLNNGTGGPDWFSNYF